MTTETTVVDSAVKAVFPLITLEQALSFDPLSEAEGITGQSYKTNQTTELLGFGLAMAHNRIKNQLLDELGDSKLSNTLEDYQRIITSIGFELAVADKFQSHHFGEEPYEETFFIYGHREKGILLSFDTYCSNHVNGGHFYYCWKPVSSTSAYGVTSSGGWESEAHVNWRRAEEFREASPKDLYWSGDHDCREAIKHHIQQLSDHGTFMPKWPEASQGRRRSGMYFMSHEDWKGIKHLHMMSKEHDLAMNRVFVRRYEMMPDWLKEIVGPHHIDLVTGEKS